METIGKIISKAEADKNFGPVVQSIALDTAEVEKLIQASGDYLLFHILESKLVVLDKNRNAMMGDAKAFDAVTPFHVFSTSKVIELLKSGNAPTTTVELRKGVLSVTNGEYTMEYSTLCPPVCPN